jgi:hypothetical protein
MDSALLKFAYVFLNFQKSSYKIQMDDTNCHLPIIQILVPSGPCIEYSNTCIMSSDPDFCGCVDVFDK